MAVTVIARPSTTQHSRGVRAFSLIELLTVLFIISLVIAILIPAVGGARNSAKRAATMTMMTNLSQGARSFELDNRRLPGFFSPAEMGSDANADRGFTTMKNVLLDLAGGVTQAAQNTAQGIFGDVGPVQATAVTVDFGQIGAPSGRGASNSKSYFSPDRNYFTAQNGPNQLTATGMTDGNRNMPEVVDAWGTPILAWVADERPAAAGAAPGDGFSAITSTGPTAKFYWNSNAAVLSSVSTGRLGRSQVYTDRAVKHSLLGAGRAADLRVKTMTGILGNPAFPKQGVANLPAEPMGNFILHAAGADGFFLGSDDRGGKLAYSDPTAGYTGAVRYQSGVDTKAEFDDVIVSGGN